MNCEDRKCEACGGTGFIQCPQCRGIAFPQDSETVSMLECDRCKRAGNVLCPECLGFARQGVGDLTDQNDPTDEKDCTDK